MALGELRGNYLQFVFAIFSIFAFDMDTIDKEIIEDNFKKWNIPRPVQDYMVVVQCSTYNHEKYIEDALKGFVMQKTSFPFCAIVIDDASTDNTPNIILRYAEQYPEIIKPILLGENHYQNKKNKSPYVNEWIKSAKYIAKCEGDDYWTDPLKLQKQVDFLEGHPDYSLCCHRFKIYYENTDTWTDDFAGEAFAENPSVEGLVVTNSENFRTRFTWTLTLCYRKASLEGIDWPPYKFGSRDFNFHYHLLKAGKGWCFADYMGVYRKHDGGIWSSLSSLDGAQTRLDCYEDLYKYNKADKVVLDRYVEWLDLFFVEFVRPSFHYHKWTRNGIDNMKFYLKHCLKTQQYNKAIRKSLKCLGIVIGIKK